MTEAFRHEDIPSERLQLEDGQVEVFFDGDRGNKLNSIILNTAITRTVEEDTPYGPFEYDELILSDGSILSPADLSLEDRIVDFRDSLETVVQLGGGALLRTVRYRNEMKFLEIVRNDTTITERKIIRDAIREEEKEKIPALLIEQREILDEPGTPELWIRLEAVFDPDKSLAGKIIMARLAYFMADITSAAIAPRIYNATDGITTPIPEQLTIHEDWLYTDSD